MTIIIKYKAHLSYYDNFTDCKHPVYYEDKLRGETKEWPFTS